MQTIYLMIGVPGSGKSSWAEQRNKRYSDGNNSIVISRDKVRFGLISEGEDYFSKEKEVVKEFYKQINQAIELQFGYIFIDATHLTKKSRAKVLNNINHEGCNLEFILIDTPIEKCLEFNNKRVGREKVPESAIMRMYNNLEVPTEEELDFWHSSFYIFKNLCVPKFSMKSAYIRGRKEENE